MIGNHAIGTRNYTTEAKDTETCWEAVAVNLEIGDSDLDYISVVLVGTGHIVDKIEDRTNKFSPVH